MPSDCFTRLTPVWEIRTIKRSDVDPDTLENWTILFPHANIPALDEAYICSLQLPINSPLRRTLTGLPMPNRVLAKRSVALEACRCLHMQKELDDNLYPVGKENLRLEEEEDYNADLEEENVPESAPRPGTTKRRQYYYKQVSRILKQGYTPRMEDKEYHMFLSAIGSRSVHRLPSGSGRAMLPLRDHDGAD